MTPTTPTTMAHPRVAVIGVGAMGSRIAANLLAAGYPVIVTNRSPGPVERLTAEGARAAQTPAEAAAHADALMVTVSDDIAAREVWHHPANGIFAGARRNLLSIEASTLSPACIRDLAARAHRHGLRFLEAPMIGSRPQVEARALIHLTAGSPEVHADARPILTASATRLHHIGAEHGSAATLKLIVNALMASQVATIAELLALAGRVGLDSASTTAVLASLPVTSPAAARAIDLIAASDFSPNFPVRLVTKDLGYLTAIAEDCSGHAPMTRAALAGYHQTSAAGHDNWDLTAIATIHEHDATGSRLGHH
ncbi:NAD(P)-dependent oxidoreductase [Nocardia sp. CNY236]|uniref:NAD(P)-dependent oxidoreductase n=1 Tax=Nocardia sp. CNY236 TaxID=1169152 RepID=UPI00041A500D|nr:NAD(P)-dependent oxidoreductase [Nocardia sp. CNY236]